MANQYEITVYSQPSIYDPCPRTIDIYFCEPSHGVDSDTGMLLLSAGYGGQANSRVFRKMRDQFADKYNYITVQCNYFGWEYMQDVTLTQDQIPKDLWNRNSDDPIRIDIALDETASNMNDMGPMQAIDQIISMKVVSDILKDNGFEINHRRIHAYGYSHGAYINYLCNAFMPGLFTGMIDNSAYLFPTYINYGRTRYQTFDNGKVIRQVFIYLLHDLIDDEEIYQLPYVYSQFDNLCHILSYHGIMDHMTTVNDKCRFLDQINHVSYKIIQDSDLDGITFRSMKHGLDADFLELFDFAIHSFPKTIEHTGLLFEENTIMTSKYVYHVTMSEGNPGLVREIR